MGSPPMPAKKLTLAERLTPWSFVVSVVALAASLIQPSILVYDHFSLTSVSISNPIPNASLIGPDHTALGTAKNIPADNDLWLVVRTEDVGQWYPVGRISVNPDGSWSTDFSLGDPGPNNAGVFEIYVYLVGSQYSGIIADDENKIEKNGYRQGLSSMPAGPTLTASVVVQRGA
jgi:hypothetical protein